MGAGGIIIILVAVYVIGCPVSAFGTGYLDGIFDCDRKALPMIFLWPVMWPLFGLCAAIVGLIAFGIRLYDVGRELGSRK